ncbi:hypothetical protein JCM3775_004969 [Rhodotorula graminis]
MVPLDDLLAERKGRLSAERWAGEADEARDEALRARDEAVKAREKAEEELSELQDDHGRLVRLVSAVWGARQGQA